MNIKEIAYDQFTPITAYYALGSRDDPLPILVDPSHGTGHRSMVLPMARAAIAAGADGVVVEMHPNPDQALTDAQQTIGPKAFEKMMKELNLIHKCLLEVS